MALQSRPFANCDVTHMLLFISVIPMENSCCHHSTGMPSYVVNLAVRAVAVAVFALARGFPRVSEFVLSYVISDLYFAHVRSD